MHKDSTKSSRCLTSSYLGKKGEEQAVSALQAAGMKIITKNFRSRHGEVDIIALDGETIVFVEVKTWSFYGLEDLQYSLDIRKQRKIIKTAKFFLSENREYSKMAIRFDVVFINQAPTGCQAPAGCQAPQVSHLASAFMERV